MALQVLQDVTHCVQGAKNTAGKTAVKLGLTGEQDLCTVGRIKKKNTKYCYLVTSILVLIFLQVGFLVRELCRRVNMQCVRASLISLFKLFFVFYHIIS